MGNDGCRGLVGSQRVVVDPTGPVLADDPAPVRRAILDAGLVTTQAGARVIRLLPPLVVTQGEIAEALDILRGVLVPCG